MKNKKGPFKNVAFTYPYFSKIGFKVSVIFSTQSLFAHVGIFKTPSLVPVMIST